MSIKHAVLGLLVERPGYGYDLIQRLNERVGPAWQLNPSVVYTALDQLEAAAYITARRREPAGEPDHTARRAARVIYEPTEDGQAEFRAWLARPSARLEPIRAEIHLKLALAQPDDMPLILDAIEQEERLTRRLQAECATADETLTSAAAVPTPLAGVAHTAAILRLQSHLAWITATRESLQSRAPSA